MDKYITGSIIRELREQKGLTQTELAQRIHVSAKAVSKWETAQGFPDISLIEPLAAALDISVSELLAGECVKNSNTSANIFKSKFYVCPICGNIIFAVGEAMISCCGIALSPCLPEKADGEHEFNVERIEDEYCILLRHPMAKQHCISFLAAVSDQGAEIIKLYPESGACARFKRSRVKYLYAYCKLHGLFVARV